MRIRPLQIEDYDALTALWDAASLSYRPRGRDSRASIARELAGPCSVFLGAEEEGRLIGAVLGTHDGRKGWINRLAVVPDRRRQRVARTLVEAFEQRMRKRGIEIVTCLVETWNSDSDRFFRALGYVRHDDIVYYSKRRSADV